LLVDEAAPPGPLDAAAPPPAPPVDDEAAPPPVPPVLLLASPPAGGVLGAVVVDEEEDEPPGTTIVSFSFTVVVEEDPVAAGAPPGTTVVVSFFSHPADIAKAPNKTNRYPLRFMSTLSLLLVFVANCNTGFSKRRAALSPRLCLTIFCLQSLSTCSALTMSSRCPNRASTVRL